MSNGGASIALAWLCSGLERAVGCSELVQALEQLAGGRSCQDESARDNSMRLWGFRALWLAEPDRRERNGEITMNAADSDHFCGEYLLDVHRIFELRLGWLDRGCGH